MPSRRRMASLHSTCSSPRRWRSGARPPGRTAMAGVWRPARWRRTPRPRMSPGRDCRRMTTTRQIGTVGLGLLGSALAHRLIGAGFDPKGYDIDAAKVAAFAKAGGVAATLDEVAHCDVVLLAVFDTDQVEDVVTHALLPAMT